MNLDKALDTFKTKYPDRKPNGYWKTKDGIVINTDPTVPGAPEVCQFLVNGSGQVSPTNPLYSDIDPDSMIKL